MPIYYCGQFTTKNILSGQNQPYTNWELIIVDDRSINDVESHFRGLMLIDERIHYTRFDCKSGAAITHNTAIRERKTHVLREASIEEFCHYHYWFDSNGQGKTKELLEQPFDEVVANSMSDYPFCICWTNHTWSNKN